MAGGPTDGTARRTWATGVIVDGQLAVPAAQWGETYVCAMCGEETARWWTQRRGFLGKRCVGAVKTLAALREGA